MRAATKAVALLATVACAGALGCSASTDSTPSLDHAAQAQTINQSDFGGGDVLYCGNQLALGVGATSLAATGLLTMGVSLASGGGVVLLPGEVVLTTFAVGGMTVAVLSLDGCMKQLGGVAWSLTRNFFSLSSDVRNAVGGFLHDTITRLSGYDGTPESYEVVGPADDYLARIQSEAQSTLAQSDDPSQTWVCGAFGVDPTWPAGSGFPGIATGETQELAELRANAEARLPFNNRSGIVFTRTIFCCEAGGACTNYGSDARQWIGY